MIYDKKFIKDLKRDIALNKFEIKIDMDIISIKNETDCYLLYSPNSEYISMNKLNEFGLNIKPFKNFEKGDYLFEEIYQLFNYIKQLLK